MQQVLGQHLLGQQRHIHSAQGPLGFLSILSLVTCASIPSLHPHPVTPRTCIPEAANSPVTSPKTTLLSRTPLLAHVFHCAQDIYSWASPGTQASRPLSPPGPLVPSCLHLSIYLAGSHGLQLSFVRFLNCLFLLASYPANSPTYRNLISIEEFQTTAQKGLTKAGPPESSTRQCQADLRRPGDPTTGSRPVSIRLSLLPVSEHGRSFHRGRNAGLKLLQL